jgi:hypothetical protein
MAQTEPQPPPRPPPNGPAATSLTCGILGLLPCLPAIGSVVAVPFAIAGLKRAARLQGSGRRIAAAGLVLGLIGILFWSTLAVLLTRVIQVTGPAVAFIRAVNAGDTAAARSCATANLTDARIQELHGTFQSLGKLKSAAPPKVSFGQAGGVPRIIVTGAGDFADGQRTFRVVLVRQDGLYKVDDMTLE